MKKWIFAHRTMTDEELVQGCIRREEKYQKILWDKYASTLFTVCRRYMKDEFEAEDVLMETMVKIYDNIEKFRGDAQLGTYLRRITINNCINKLRRRKDKISLDEFELDFGYQNTIVEKMAAEDLMKLIEALPEGYKQVFNMYAIDGYSHKEIADTLGIQEVTSRTQFSKAKKALQTALEKITEVKKYG